MSFIFNPSTGGGATAPGGADTQIQYNNAGAFDGTENGVYDAALTAFGFKAIRGLSATPLLVSGFDDTGTGNAGGVFIQAGDANSGAGFAGDLTLLGGYCTLGIASGGVTVGGGISTVAGVAGGNVTIRAGAGGTGAAASLLRLRNESNSIGLTITGNSGTGLQMSIFGAAAITRPTTAIAAATFVAGAGVAIQDVSTFDGYTLAQIAKALRNFGLLT